jgi:penicillin amidase
MRIPSPALRATLLAALAATAACSDDPAPGDAGTTLDASQADVGTPDSGTPDTGTPDTGATDARAADAEPTDSGPADSGVADAGPPPEPKISGLSAPVTVSFDENGVTHIKCRTDADCFAAQGYYHAAHRFAQMDLRRRFVRGTIGELFGPLSAATLDQDYASRLFLATPEGGDLAQSMLDAAKPETRAMLEAYTRGVNAWLADYRAGRNGARLSEEWASASTLLTDWEPLDSVAGIIALVASLTDSTGDDIDRGAQAAAMSTEAFFDLFGLMVASRATQSDGNRAALRTGPVLSPELMTRFRELQGRLALAERALAEARANLPRFPGLVEKGFGSNNWVVRPSLTANGTSALLANDPHLGMTNPATWYLIHLDAKTEGTGRVHIAGASFAGMPGVILGQNEDIAWGATTTYFDQADVYVETLSQDGAGVIRGKSVIPFIRRDIVLRRLNFAGGYDVETRPALYVPGHGPVLSIDTARGVAITSRWTGHTLTTDLDFVWDIALASSAETARAAFRNSTSIGQNFVVADRAGHVGWYPYNKLPNRQAWVTEQPAWVPIPGDGNYEWDGFLAEDQLPQATDPIGGYIATANADMTGQLFDGNPTNDGFPYLQAGADPGYRQERIAERIVAGAGTHSLDTMVSIQNDVVSLPGRLITPFAQSLTQGNADLTAAGNEVREALRGWTEFSCPTGLTSNDPRSALTTDARQLAETAGCTAFHVMFGRLYRNTFADEIAAAGRTDRANVAAMFVQILSPDRFLRPGGYWDDVSTPGRVETSTHAFVRALNEAGDWLQANVGPARSTWAWGRIHTVRLRADLFSSAGIGTFDSPAFAADGGLFTIDVANPSGATSHDYTFGSGPSMRFACEANAARPVRCLIDLPGGQRHLRTDRHYIDVMRDHWLTGTRIPLHFLASEVAGSTVESVRITAP